MKKTCFFVFLLSLSGISAPLFAQESFRCGLSTEDAQLITKRLLANREFAEQNPVDMRAPVYVPIKFHLVARNDGTGRVEESKVLDELCFLNQVFADLEIQFYIKDGFNYLDNTAVYSGSRTAEDGVMTARRVNNAMNVWVVDEPDADNASVLGFYTVRKDWIVINRSEIGGSSKALAHEIGHFFSLQHTHYGWDSKPWDSSVGNPAPVIAPDGVPTEKANGSNCRTSGDFICDTPADYNGLGWNSCNYTKGARDPDSTLIDPDETNYMSYFFGCPLSQQKFSDDQKRIIRADLLGGNSCNDCLPTPSRTYLQQSFNPVTIATSPTLISPIGGQDAPGGGTVRLEWSFQTGVSAYIVEIDRAPTFSIQPIRLIVQTPQVDIPNLVVGRRYYWRVRPYNSISTCNDLRSTVESFVASNTTSVNTIPFVRTWSVSPNPVSQSGDLELYLESQEAFDADIVLYGIAGQVVRPFASTRFQMGANRIALSTGGLSPGVYLLALSTDKGRLNQRVVVME